MIFSKNQAANNFLKNFAILPFLITMTKNKIMNFLDFRIAQSLISRFGKKNLETLVDQEFSVSYDGLSPAERSFYLEKLSEKNSIFEEIQKHNLEKIYEMECKIAEILFYMERTGVALDSEKMKKI